MPIQDFVDIEETVLFCQKMANRLYSCKIANGWSFDDNENYLRDINNKNRVKLSFELSDLFCDFIINPPEKIQESTATMRMEAIYNEVEYIKGVIIIEENMEDLEQWVDVDDIDDLLNPTSLKKRLFFRVQQTQSRIKKFSTVSELTQKSIQAPNIKIKP